MLFWPCCCGGTATGDCCDPGVTGDVIWPADWASETCPSPRTYGDLFVRFPSAAVQGGSTCGAVCSALAAGFVLPEAGSACTWLDLFTISNGCGSTTWYLDVAAIVTQVAGTRSKIGRAHV